jgi:hypothetical protein
MTNKYSLLFSASDTTPDPAVNSTCEATYAHSGGVTTAGVSCAAS